MQAKRCCASTVHSMHHKRGQAGWRPRFEQGMRLHRGRTRACRAEGSRQQHCATTQSHTRPHSHTSAWPACTPHNAPRAAPHSRQHLPDAAEAGAAGAVGQGRQGSAELRFDTLLLLLAGAYGSIRSSALAARAVAVHALVCMGACRDAGGGRAGCVGRHAARILGGPMVVLQVQGGRGGGRGASDRAVQCVAVGEGGSM